MRCDHVRLVWKSDLRSGKWPDLMNDPDMSCYISADASWQNKHDDTWYTALTRALMGLGIFHHLIGGCWGPASNSAPRRHSGKPKNVFESSLEIITKVFHSIFRLCQYWGHQRSSNVKFSEIPYCFENVPLSQKLSILDSRPGKKHSIALELCFRYHAMRL